MATHPFGGPSALTPLGHEENEDNEDNEDNKEEKDNTEGDMLETH